MDNAAPTTGVPPNIRKVIGQYVALRNRKRLLEQQHKEALRPFTDVMDQLEGQLLQYMQKIGSNSIATNDGTAYQSTRPSATIRDAAAFREWVIANKRFDLIDWRANAPHVFDYIAEHKAQPPGLNCSTFTSIRFRSPEEN